jgi:ribosome maturation factor RimP
MSRTDTRSDDRVLKRKEGVVHDSSGNTLFAEAFARVVHALPHQPEFRNIEIVATSARHGRDETHLSVTVDRDGGVDMATCERIAARINAALDAFADPYTLEVGSAGLNRPLTKPGDYERFVGRNVRVLTTLPINNAKTHRGLLGGVRGTNVILQFGGKELPIPLAVIRSANLEYDIRADLQRAKQEKTKKIHPKKAKNNESKSFRDPSGVGGAQAGPERR